MKVLFDVSCLDHERISGVGTYARNLLAGLLQRPGLELKGSWRLSRHRRLRYIRGNCSVALEPFVPAWSSLNFGKYDVFHGPDFRVPLAYRFARVVTIHDFAFYHRGLTSAEFASSRQKMMEILFKKIRPEAVIAVSEFTRREIAERFPQYAEKIFTCHHGADHLLVPSNRGHRPVPQPYFLFCGTIELRKNLDGIIAAFERLKSKGNYKDLRLLLVGKPGFGYDQIRKRAALAPCASDILFPGFISNIGLVDYYQYAEAFVFPSHYEGFGFPILEAMRLGCPVITSSTTAACEVAGEAALKVHPLQVDQLVEAMEKILEDKDLKLDLRQKGFQRGQEFTWSKCAQDTEAVYRRTKSFFR